MKQAETKKKKVKLPIRAYLLYLLLASFLMTGVTFSRYITASSGGDEARVAQIGEISITEEGDFENETNTAIIIPGVNLKKDAEVNFEGSEAATYVFVKVEVDGGWTETGRSYSYKDDDAVLLSWSVAESWTYLDDGVYYRTLEPNEVLTDEDIITGGTITVSADITEAQIAAMTGLSITFQATAVQSSGFADAADAWASVSAK